MRIILEIPEDKIKATAKEIIKQKIIGSTLDIPSNWITFED